MAETVKRGKYDLVAPEGHADVGKDVFAVLSKVVEDKIKLGLHDRWKRNNQLRRNKHWQGDSPLGLPLVSANLLFTHTQRTANTLTDNDPTFNVAAIGKIEGMEKDQLMDLQRTTEHWWRDQEQQDIFETSVLNGEQYGIALEHIVFNSELEYGLGEVECINVNPYYFGWYPVKLASIRDLQKSEALVYYYPVSVRSLQQKYPDKADLIKGDDAIIKELNEEERRGGGVSKESSVMTSIGGTIRELLNFTAGNRSEGDEETILVHMWLRDRTMVTTKILDAQGREVAVVMPKYTGGIRYILACSQKIVLEDKDNPNVNPELDDQQAQSTYLYDKFPFAGANSIKDTSNAWGLSDYEQLEWLNMEIDKSLSQFVVEKDRAARKKLVVPKSSGVPVENFTNLVGIVEPIDANEGAGIHWLEPPQVSVDYDRAIGMFKEFFFLVSGTFELDQAQTPGRDVIAYKAIAALLERAATMMRGKIRSYSRLIRERGRMYLSDVMNFYTEERWITYKDENGKEASKPIIGSEMAMPAKLTVVSGSTLPISRVQQREEALALFQSGAIDQSELLDKLDWNNRAEVVQRMMEGPLGAVMKRFALGQVPQPIQQWLKMVAETEDKDLEKDLATGNIPPFMDFMQQLMAQMQGKEEQPGADPTAQVELEKAAAEAQKLRAETEKVFAERDLAAEKVLTERVGQQQKLAGIKYDDEILKMERAKVVAAIESEARGHKLETTKMGMDFAAKAAATVAKGATNRPGYNEKGMKSNNVE